MIRSPLLTLHKLHEEAFELMCVSIRIENRWRKLIGKIFRSLAFILGDAAISPVNRDADLIGLLSVDQHGLDTVRDHSFCNVLRTSAYHFYLVTAGYTSLACKLDGNLNKG